MNTARPGEARFVRLNDSAGNMQDCVGRAPSLRRALLPRRRWARISRPTSVETGIMAFMFTHRQNLERVGPLEDRKSTRLNSSHVAISYAVFCLKKKNNNQPCYNPTVC